MADVLSPMHNGADASNPAKRKRHGSRSPSPPPSSRRRSRSPARAEPTSAPAERISIKVTDRDPARRRERELEAELRRAEAELKALDEDVGGAASGNAVTKTDTADAARKAEMTKMALTKAGGAYIPPHRMRKMMEEMEREGVMDEKGMEYQRLRWDALRKSLNGLVNKVNVANIKYIVPELFGENLVRGRGLFCRSIMRAQASSLPFTPIFAALVAVINTKLPRMGDLLLSRLVLQFRRAFKRNDKVTCHAVTTFIAQLCNQRVAHEILALEILALLLERPTDDSVEIAVGFMREVGAYLAEIAPKANTGVYDMFRQILHQTEINKRVQYMVEVLFQVRRDGFKDNPVIPDGLDLVEEDDAITHRISLDDAGLKAEDSLNVFKFDPQFEQSEEDYAAFKREVLGDSDDEESPADDEGEDEPEGEEGGAFSTVPGTGTVDIHDHTGTDVVNFRRRVYLTLMSALDFEEAVHKLLKMDIQPGFEPELCNMIVECCSQERTYAKFYGLIGERLCKLNQVWSQAFDTGFRTYFDTIHRYDTNKLRNIARFFGHLVATDAIPWTVFEIVKMNEDDTTSSSRIFIKILFQEMVEGLGLPELKKRFNDRTMQPYYQHMFPLDNPKNTRFSINFWTSIKMGLLTESMREHLKNAPQIMLQQRRALEAAVSSSSSSDSSSDTSSNSDSDDSRDRSRRRRSPPRRRRSSTPPRRRRSSTPPRRREDRRDDRRSPPPAAREVDAADTREAARLARMQAMGGNGGPPPRRPSPRRDAGPRPGADNGYGSRAGRR